MRGQVTYLELEVVWADVDRGVIGLAHVLVALPVADLIAGQWLLLHRGSHVPGDISQWDQYII